MTDLKKRLCTAIISFMVVIIVAISAKVPPASAWGPSMHAYTTKESLSLEKISIANYNARMGSMVPDFFSYLREVGLIDQDTALKLHGITDEPDVIPATTYLYDIASEKLSPWDLGLKYFAEGIRTHVYADIRAHNIDDGYVQGPNMWIDILQGKILEEDRDALHGALELAVDSLLVHKFGLQLSDILYSINQANFLEDVIEEAFEELGLTLNFDVKQEFKKYLALMRALEKASRLYAPYLIRGTVDEAVLGKLGEVELIQLFEVAGQLSQDQLQSLLNTILVLLNYPKEIYETVNTEGIDWEIDALPDVIEFCRLD